MATHFQIIGLDEDENEVILWSDVLKSDKLTFSIKCMFDVQKAKNTTAKLMKWTQGEKQLIQLL